MDQSLFPSQWKVERRERERERGVRRHIGAGAKNLRSVCVGAPHTWTPSLSLSLLFSIQYLFKPSTRSPAIPSHSLSLSLCAFYSYALGERTASNQLILLVSLSLSPLLFHPYSKRDVPSSLSIPGYLSSNRTMMAAAILSLDCHGT